MLKSRNAFRPIWVIIRQELHFETRDINLNYNMLRKIKLKHNILYLHKYHLTYEYNEIL